MLLVFGALNIDIQLKVHSLPHDDTNITATSYSINDGGRAANQAFAAARSGAKVALISKTGTNDICAQMIQRLRQAGVITSGIAKSDTLPAGLLVSITDKLGTQKNIHAQGANIELSAEQVPDEIVDAGTIALVQSEISPQINEEFLKKMKLNGATTILSLAPSIELTQKTLSYVDYLIINQIQAQSFAKKLDLTITDSEALVLAKALAIQGDLVCIITRGNKDSLAITPDGSGWRIESLPLDEVIDKTGAEDAYCGTFAACLYEEIDLPIALKRASIAASLACTKEGVQSAFPYMSDIDEHAEKMNDPEPINT